MKKLRLRIALLVIGAIIAVVGMATSVAIGVIGRPGPERMIADAALQIDLVSRMAEALPDQFEPGGPEVAGLKLTRGPDGANEDVRLTDELRHRLAEIGQPRDVVVSERVAGGPVTVSVPIPSQGWWISMPISTQAPPPRAGWWILLGWMSAIVLGAAMIAVVISDRLTKPLQLLERAIASIGPDGVLPLLPEIGSGEVKATAQALNRLSVSLKKAMESRMRLVAAAGHDLRTPMTRMRLRAEFLGDEDERALWLKDLEELDRIADSAIRLVREEVEAGSRDVVETSQFLRELTSELSEQHVAIKLGPTVQASIAVAPLALTRALRNVLINASTHGHGGTVGSRIEGRFVVIKVQDHGPGIPEGLLERVFEPFFRVDPARRQSVPGAGLGLAIAKEIIERNGGRIAVRNGECGGLIQEIWLPLVEPAAAKA